MKSHISLCDFAFYVPKHEERRLLRASLEEKIDFEVRYGEMHVRLRLYYNPN